MVLFDLIAVVLNADRVTDGLTLAAANQQLSGAALWLGRTRSATLLALVLAVFYLRFREGIGGLPGRTMSAAFVVYWVGALLVPAIAAGDFARVHSFTYPLLVGLVISSIAPDSRRPFFLLFTWTILVATVSSISVFVLVPKAVSEVDYEDAIFGAFPRFQGFTFQANALGAILAPWLLVLFRWPLRPLWINRIAWVAGIIALLLSQSKTSIVGFTLSGFLLLLMCGDSQRRLALLAALPALALGAVGMVLLALSVDLFPAFSPDRLKSVTTVSGRSLVWSLALDAWQANPWFGYGPQLFRDGAFDSYPHMSWTSHAHNQVIDTLGRAGLFGLMSLLIMLVTLALGVGRLKGADRNLGVALYLLMITQSLSETPLILGVGPMNVSFWMLMALVVSRPTAPLTPTDTWMAGVQTVKGSVR